MAPVFALFFRSNSHGWMPGDGSPDTFCIWIWYEGVGEVFVYDSGFGQEIGGGSIVIHTKKK